MSFPADAIGHHLHFIHPPERDYKRTAACTGCSWSAPAPGTGYARGRQLHTAAHAHLVAAEALAEQDRAGLLRGLTFAVPAGLAIWAALGWLAARWW